MKQTQFVLLATITLAGATLANTAGVKAADVTAKTTAEFTVKAGNLTLDAAPDFKFGDENTTISDVMNSYLPQADQKVTNHVDETEGKSVADHQDSHVGGALDPAKTNELKISDYRGVGSHWTLSAQLSSFYGTNGGTANGTIKLAEDTKLGISEGTTISTASVANILDSATAADKSGKQEGLFTADSTITDAELKLDNQKDIKDGTYDANITWTLTDGSTTRSVD